MDVRRLMVLLVLVTMPMLATPPPAAAADSRPTAAEARRDYDAGVLFVDVRTEEEWSAGHLRSALHLPVDAVASRAATALPDKNKPIVTYCKAGGRAQAAAEALRALGYTNVTAMTGGYADLESAGYPVEKGGGPSARP